MLVWEAAVKSPHDKSLCSPSALCVVPILWPCTLCHNQAYNLKVVWSGRTHRWVDWS